MTQIPREIVGLDFDRVERNIMEALALGNPINVEGLSKCLYSQSDVENSVQKQVSKLRKKLVGTRYRISSGQENGELVYRLTVFLSSAKV